MAYILVQARHRANSNTILLWLKLRSEDSCHWLPDKIFPEQGLVVQKMNNRPLPLPTILAAITVAFVMVGLHVSNDSPQAPGFWHPIDKFSPTGREMGERKLKPDYFDQLSATDAFSQLIRFRLRPNIVDGWPIGYTPMMLLKIGAATEDIPFESPTAPSFSYEDVFQSMERSGKCRVFRHQELILACIGARSSIAGGITIAPGGEEMVQKLRQINPPASLEKATLEEVLQFYAFALSTEKIAFHHATPSKNGEMRFTSDGERPHDVLDHMNAVFLVCGIHAEVGSNGVTLR